MAFQPATATAAANPFRGLLWYEEEDRGALFGRDADFDMMRDRIYSGRTTLLFAASGVGKTSFLRAKLLPGLEDEFVACYHRAWASGEPRQAVMESLAAGLSLTELARLAPGIEGEFLEQY